MDKRDWNPLIFVLATAALVVMILAFVLFPEYRLLDGTIVRSPVWNPPILKMKLRMEELTEDDLVRLQADETARAQMADMIDRNEPFAADANWLGYERDLYRPRAGRRLPPNPLLRWSVIAGIAYYALMKWRGIF